jgi:hypothetical protein
VAAIPAGSPSCPSGHAVLHHGALFELVPNGVRMVWESHIENLLEVIGDNNVFLVGVVSLLVVVIIATASSNCDPLGVPLWPLLIAFDASLSAFAGSPWVGPLGCHRGPTSLHPGRRRPQLPLHQSLSGGNVKQLSCGLWLITAEFMH